MDFSKLSLFATPPSERYVSHRGRPAAALPHGGLPAYESEHGALLVMENLVVFPGGPMNPPMLLPNSYMMVCLRSRGDGLTALHDDPDAVWSWRPLLYALGRTETQRMGSQNELEYRKGLWDVQIRKAELDDLAAAVAVEQTPRLRHLGGGKVPAFGRVRKNTRKRLYREYVERFFALSESELPSVVANRRAEAILRENLSPQQRLDLETLKGFFVRGSINRLYFVEPGNGFAIVDAVTHEPKVSLCLHPEEWLPYADVALATKLSIDAGRESEAELLEAANPRILRTTWRTKASDRRAYRLEERFRLYP